jgi:hypothetical protein
MYQEEWYGPSSNPQYDVMTGLGVAEGPPGRGTRSGNPSAALAEDEELENVDAQEPPPPVMEEHHTRSRNERRNGVRTNKVAFKMHYQANPCNNNDGCTSCKDDETATKEAMGEHEEVNAVETTPLPAPWLVHAKEIARQVDAWTKHAQKK